jgi:hypothetical protein
MPTHIFAIPQLDSPIAARGVDDSLSSPTNNVDTGCVASQRKLKFPLLGIPYSDRGVL